MAGPSGPAPDANGRAIGPRDHGGGVDAARALWGGDRSDWLDLSTGINPVAWPGEPGRPAPPPVPPDAWTALPDAGAAAAFEAAARRLLRPPDGAALLAVPGASLAIAQLPRLSAPGAAWIPGPTYNEHAAAFAAAGWRVVAGRRDEEPRVGANARALSAPGDLRPRGAGADVAPTSPAHAGSPHRAAHAPTPSRPEVGPRPDRPAGPERGRSPATTPTAERGQPVAGPNGLPDAEADALPRPRAGVPLDAQASVPLEPHASVPLDAVVVVHPNNPDGRLWDAEAIPSAPLTVIDESFCDLMPERSLMALSARPGTVVLRSFGKFWGLAGLRLGVVVGCPRLVGALAEAIGPWPVSGPALALGEAALRDRGWARRARLRLGRDAARLDALLAGAGAAPAGGTDLFRLVTVRDAARLCDHLARHRILVRVFPWSAHLVRVGPPPEHGWARLEAALARAPA